MNILKSLELTYPEIVFQKGISFSWSPRKKSISYKEIKKPQDCWSLLHELGHGVLDHQSYGLDIDLLKLEVEAWREAKKIAKIFDINIEESHINKCLDTYRDWLHRRSTCPNCNVVSLQINTSHYKCFNCSCLWRVGRSRLCRIHRQVIFKKPVEITNPS